MHAAGPSPETANPATDHYEPVPIIIRSGAARDFRFSSRLAYYLPVRKDHHLKG